MAKNFPEGRDVTSSLIFYELRVCEFVSAVVSYIVRELYCVILT